MNGVVPSTHQGVTREEEGRMEVRDAYCQGRYEWGEGVPDKPRGTERSDD